MTDAAKIRHHTHIGVYTLILRQDNVLLVKKARGPYTGSWDLPGGRIEFGESPEAALARELWEETGFQMSAPPQLINAGSHSVVWNASDNVQEMLHHLGFIYRATVNEEPQDPKVLQEDEDAAEAAWKARVDLTHLPLTPFARLVIEALL